MTEPDHQHHHEQRVEHAEARSIAEDAVDTATGRAEDARLLAADLARAVASIGAKLSAVKASFEGLTAVLQDDADSRRRTVRWLSVVGVLFAVMLAFGLVTFLDVRKVATENRHQALVTEVDVLAHRVKKEECVIRVLNEVVEKRINNRTTDPIVLCPLDDLPKLKQALEDAERRLADE